MKPLVIIVDDNKDYLRSFALLLEMVYNYEVRTAPSARTAIKLARNLERPATLLLDLHVGGRFEGVKLLKQMHRTARYPLVAIYVSGDPESEAQALAQGGAIAYKVKPINPKVIQSYIEKVGPEQAEVAHRATRDFLTGLLNRGGFLEAVTIELTRAVRNKTPTACIFVDIDSFKIVNDMYGYEVGDTTISTVARCIKERATDIVGRWGGEEYVVFLPVTTEEQAKMVAHRLEQVIEKTEIQVGDGRFFSVTASTGVLIIDAKKILVTREHTLEDLLNHSSKLMKAAKNRKKAEKGTGR